MQLKEIDVRPVIHEEYAHYHKLMQHHHYQGSAHPVGETLRYVAIWHTQWIAFTYFFICGLKMCAT